MVKVDYNAKFKQIVENLTQKPKLLLHSCCGPCSSWVLEKVCKNFDVCVVYYNPNIYPKEEYEKRKSEQTKLLNILNVKFMDCDYNEQEFLSAVCGLESQPEGGKRCNMCFLLRLEKTACLAKQNGFEYFGTTLTVSPHKNAQIINLIGENLENKYGIKYLYSDFKKENGYLNSINLSKKYNLYRQNYCGCRFALENEKIVKNN